MIRKSEEEEQHETIDRDNTGLLNMSGFSEDSQ